MLKRVAAIFIVSFFGLCTVSYLYSVSLRTSDIITGKNTLREAYKEYQEHGAFTNGSSRSQVWLSTNQVTIAGTHYRCFMTLRDASFHEEGVLAMTTNEVFIWLDSRRPPQIIHAKYRAPLFPPRF